MKDREYRKVTLADGHVTVDPMPTPEALSDFYARPCYQKRPSKTYREAYSEDELAHRRLRADLLIEAVRRALGSGRDAAGDVLEVGCGEGFVLAAAARAGFSVHGLDFSDYAIDRFHPELKEKVATGDACRLLDRLTEEGRAYDVCVLHNVLEHVIDPGRLLAKLGRILAPQGVAAITVPNDFSRLQARARGS